jgi:hypothetical protein
MSLVGGNEEQKQQAKHLPIIDKKARRVRMPVWQKENHFSMRDLGAHITPYLRECNKNHS